MPKTLDLVLRVEVDFGPLLESMRRVTRMFERMFPAPIVFRNTYGCKRNKQVREK